MTNTGPAPWGTDPEAPWGRLKDGTPAIPSDENWTGPDAGAPWGRGEDGKPILPVGGDWTDIPELFDRYTAQIRARVDQAQTGPWRPAQSHETPVPDTVVTQYDGYTHTIGTITTHQPADLELILHAQSGLEWCLNMIDKLRTQLAAQQDSA